MDTQGQKMTENGSKEAFQDGGQFYSVDGTLVADYGDLRDSDLLGAQAARAKFLDLHPDYVLIAA